MTTREYFNQLKIFEYHVLDLREKLESSFAVATSIVAPSDNEYVQSSGTSDRIGEYAVKLAEYSKQYRYWHEKYLDLRQEITHRIYTLDEKNAEILMLKIIFNESVADISKVIDKTERHTRRLINNAINEFDSKYKNEY